MSSERRALVAQHIERLTSEAWLGASRHWWPRYLFHTTDLLNAVQIIESGALQSRRQAVAANLLKTESASRTVLGMTDDQWLHYVRFYFRPRTPFTYANEGVRPQSLLRFGGAHQPVPICMLFLAFSGGGLLARAVPVVWLATAGARRSA